MKITDFLTRARCRRNQSPIRNQLKRLRFEGLEQRLLMTAAPPVIFEMPLHGKYQHTHNIFTINNFNGPVKALANPQLDGPEFDFTGIESFTQSNSTSEFKAVVSATNGEFKAQFTGSLEHTAFNRGDYTNMLSQKHIGAIIGWVRVPYTSSKIFREYEYAGNAIASQSNGRGLILNFPGVSSGGAGNYPISLKDQGNIRAGGRGAIPTGRIFPQYPGVVYVPTDVAFPSYTVEAPGASFDPTIQGQTLTRFDWDFSLTIRMWIDEGVPPTVDMSSTLPTPWVGSTSVLSNLSVDSDNTDGTNGILISKWRVVDPNGTEILTGTGDHVELKPTVAGIHRVTLTVDDDEGMRTSKEFLFDVTTNLPPVVVAPPPLANVLANIPTEIILPESIFSDPDQNQTLTWSMAGANQQPLPSWIQFDSQTRKVILLPHDSSVGESTVRISVTDSGNPSLSAVVDWRLNVEENRFPMHASIDPLNVDRDESVSPLDVLVLVNWLNSGGSPVVARPLSARPIHYMDVDADNSISPLDVLVLVNYFNRSKDGEGESTIDNLFIRWSVDEKQGGSQHDIDTAIFAINDEIERKSKRSRSPMP